jgi:hypothetical protein
VVPDDAIIGIHNYCDRWCERCPFTARCSVAATLKAAGPDKRAQDINNQEFWDAMGESMAEAEEMLREHCAEMGIDPDAPPSPEDKAEEARIDREVDENRLVRAAEDYMLRVRDWLKASEPMLEAKKDELNLKARLDLPGGGDVRAEAADVKELLEVVQWYFIFIAAKVHRAVDGLVRGTSDLMDDDARDSDGSAKIALIAIDRSMAAWTRLRGHFPEQKDAMLDTLVQLDRLRRGLERDFPRARAFVRPGFDEQEKP